MMCFELSSLEIAESLSMTTESCFPMPNEVFCIFIRKLRTRFENAVIRVGLVQRAVTYIVDDNNTRPRQVKHTAFIPLLRIRTENVEYQIYRKTAQPPIAIDDVITVVVLNPGQPKIVVVVPCARALFARIGGFCFRGTYLNPGAAVASALIKSLCLCQCHV
jgi:hypothetical protein